VHCTEISPEFECQGQRSRSPVTKNTKKCGILFGSRPLGHGPRGIFFGRVPRGRGYASGKISACCLVLNKIDSSSVPKYRKITAIGGLLEQQQTLCMLETKCSETFQNVSSMSGISKWCHCLECILQQNSGHMKHTFK